MTDYDRLQFGYEMLKRVATATETVDEPEFYELLAEGLAALDNLKINLAVIQTWFYLRLATLLGSGLNTATDSSGMKLVEDTKYDFDYNEQVFRHNPAGRFGSEHIKLLRVMASNRPDVIAKIAGVDEIIDDCWWLAQGVVKL
jgi:hypothetical protein